MPVITADETLQALLSGVTEVVEIRDPSGALLGYFRPAGQDEQQLDEESSVLFDPKELDRLKDAGAKGLSSKDMMKHLQPLEVAQGDRQPSPAPSESGSHIFEDDQSALHPMPGDESASHIMKNTPGGSAAPGGSGV